MLGSRIEEQERMIELVRQGACKRALQEMDEKALRKMRPEQVSRLLSALIPFRSRPAREIEELVFQNGRWSWTEKDEEGFWLHEQMIRGGRVDMAAKATERIRKREAGDSGLSFVWAELVVYLLDKCQRLPARNMLEKGILRCMDEEESCRVLESILDYQDLELLGIALKYTRNIFATMSSDEFKNGKKILPFHLKRELNRELKAL